MKKTDTQIQTPTKEDKLHQRTQGSPQYNLKEDILQVLNENFIEMILDRVNQNVQQKLKKFQDNKNRQFEDAKEEIKETK
jgi:hypothetical protein